MTKKVEEVARNDQRATAPEGGEAKAAQGARAGIDTIWERANIVFDEALNKAADQAETAISKANEAARAAEDIISKANKAVDKALELIASEWAPIMERFNNAVEASQATFQVWSTLSPYVEEELQAHPEIYGDDEHPEVGTDVPLSVLVAAAAKRARAAGVDVPMLAAEAKEKEDKKERKKNRNKRFSESIAKRTAAKETGALMGVDRLSTVADKTLGFDLFTSRVQALLSGDIKDLMIDPETGAIDLYDLSQKGVELKDVKEVNSAFLLWLFSIAYYFSDLRENNSNNSVITINIPGVLNKMEIDPRPIIWLESTGKYEGGAIARREPLSKPSAQRFEAFMDIVRPYLNIAAWFGKENNRKLLPIVNFMGYDEATENIDLSIPYMFTLVEYEKLHSKKYAAITSIFHTNIMNENQAAVEIANRIAMGVIERGVTTTQDKAYVGEKRKPSKETHIKENRDGTKEKIIKEYKDQGQTVTVREDAKEDAKEDKRSNVFYWSIQFKNLIGDCPQIKQSLEGIRTAKGPKELALLEEAKRIGTLPDPQALADARKADHKTDPQKFNKKLKDALDRAIHIILDKSDMPDFYAEFEIGRGTTRTPEQLMPYRAPTKTQIGDYLIIRHKGKNPNYAKTV